MAGFNVARSLRIAVYLRDQCRCMWCGRHVVIGATTKRSDCATLDHVDCRSRGGDHDATNLVTSCARCNSVRQDTPVATWAAHVDDMRGRDEGATLASVVVALAEPIEPYRRIARAFLRENGRSMRRVGAALAAE